MNNNNTSNNLMKINDIASFLHLQFPKWLLDDSRYNGISLEGRFTYMLLFNRFQLSKLNGWKNDRNEVYVIYTRKELAGKLNVCEKRASAAIKELIDHNLIWEKRCGRGMANQIFLVQVSLNEKDAIHSTGGPLDAPDIRTEDYSGHDEGDTTASAENTQAHSRSLPTQEPQNVPFKNRQNSRSKDDFPAVQEPPNMPRSYIDFSYNNFSSNQCQSMSGHEGRLDTDGDGQDSEELINIFHKAELAYLEEDQRLLIERAIERLYYSDSIRIGNCIYPQFRIRLNLKQLDFLIIQDTLERLTSNQNKVRNSGAYVTTVLFNTILESASDLAVDPYLNQMRQASRHRAVESRQEVALL